MADSGAGYTDVELSGGADIPRLWLSAQERQQVSDLVDTVLTEAAGQPLEQRLNRVAVHAYDLPPRLRTVLTDFRLTGRPYGGLVLSGLPVDEAALGPTPASYSDEPDRPEVIRAGAMLLLVGSLLGAPFSFATQQRGRLVLDVFPVNGHQDSQLGSSSTTNLEWHNEDAFHPHRADWIMLLGLRNHDRVPTTFAPIQTVELDEETRSVLFEDRFIILPDESHTVEFNSATTGLGNGDYVAEGFGRIAAMQQQPARAPVLSGNPNAPFVRLDPAFMQRELDDDRAERALSTVIEAITCSLRDVVLDSGELLLIDNKRAVHGRRPFQARYDGTDRWLRRINVTADLRKSEDRRHGVHSRAVV